MTTLKRYVLGRIKFTRSDQFNTRCWQVGAAVGRVVVRGHVMRHRFSAVGDTWAVSTNVSYDRKNR